LSFLGLACFACPVDDLLLAFACSSGINFAVVGNYIIIINQYSHANTCYFQVRVTNLKDAADHIGEVLKRVKKAHLERAYKIKEWYGSVS